MNVRYSVLLVAVFFGVPSLQTGQYESPVWSDSVSNNVTHVVADHEGGNATLRCTLPVSDTPNIEWRIGSLRFGGYEMIYNSSDGHINEKGSGFSDRFYIDNDDPRTLYIDVIINLAFVYTCRSQLSNGTALEEHILLDVVFNHDCSSWKSNKNWTEGESATLSCGVTVFRQKPLFVSSAETNPELAWYRGESDEPIKEATYWPNRDRHTGITYAFKAQRKDDGQTFICRMTYLHYKSQCSVTMHVNPMDVQDNDGDRIHVAVGVIFLSVSFALLGSQ